MKKIFIGLLCLFFSGNCVADTSVKLELNKEQKKIRSLITGKWLGSHQVKEGGHYKWIINRLPDGAYHTTFRMYDSSKDCKEHKEFGKWGVSDSTYFSILEGWLRDGQFKSVDVNESKTIENYKIISLTEKSFNYEHFTSGNKYTVRKVTDDFVFRESCRSNRKNTGRIIYAWWITIRFEPDAEEVEKIPVNLINSDWEKIKVINLDSIPKEALESDSHDPINKFGHMFSYIGDINNDQKEEKVLLGTYKDKLGGYGRFLLILNKANKGWKKVFVSMVPGKPGFSVMWKRDGKLFWSLCMECGSQGSVIWNGDGYEVRWADEDYG